MEQAEEGGPKYTSSEGEGERSAQQLRGFKKPADISNSSNKNITVDAVLGYFT